MSYHLENVYFIWGKGKTTIAHALREKYGFFVYGTDEARDRLMDTATPDKQPNMCRDWVGDYGVRDFWELPSEVIAYREELFLREMTPLVLEELSNLAQFHNVIICEGDIDYAAVAPIAKHTLFLHSTEKIDFFNRPDHCHMLDSVKKRTNISEEDKEKIIENAYKSVSPESNDIPKWVNDLKVPTVTWNYNTPIEETLKRIEKAFGFITKTSEKTQKILLTSNGLETEFLEKTFLSLIEKDPEIAKVLFVPTAAIYPDAILVLPKCMNDLLRVGIKKENISVYDMHYPLSHEEIEDFDAVYFTGGDPSYLLRRINESTFRNSLIDFIDNGGVFLGVSAGSIIAAHNLDENLDLIDCQLYVHCKEGTPPKDILSGDNICLTGKNAILIYNSKKTVIE